MNRTFKLSPFLFALLLLPTRHGIAESPAASSVVITISVEDAITPVTSRYVVEAIREAENLNARALILRLDTPGGLDASMREATKAILGSAVPVVVWVGPSGARAASAGLFITIAAHVAAMAPGTNIGAAHPVGVGVGGQMDSTLSQKVENDAVAYARSIAMTRGRNADWVERAVRQSVAIDADEAARLHVVDILAPDMRDLLRQIDCRIVQTSRGPDTLRTRDAMVRPYEMSLREKILSVLSNPNIAYLLFLAGILGIFFELSNPGAILPGVVGGISLILALFAFQTLSVNFAGIMLILLAVVLFVAEIKITSHGVLSIGGVICLLLGSLMLFRPRIGEPGVSLGVIVPAVIMTAAFFVFAVAMALRAQRMRPVTGSEGMIGEIGIVIEQLNPRGRMRVRGEVWIASASTPIPEGAEVQVVSVDGLHLIVTQVEGRRAPGQEV
jgi:membrane-bound serine protease (ClpP class)